MSCPLPVLAENTTHHPWAPASSRWVKQKSHRTCNFLDIASRILPGACATVPPHYPSLGVVAHYYASAFWLGGTHGPRVFSHLLYAHTIWQYDMDDTAT